MSTVSPPRATRADLMRFDGKAELIAGRIEPLMATGFRPHRIALRITVSLNQFAEKHEFGVAFADNMGFIVPELSSGRESFSPDAAFYSGPLPQNEMEFIDGPPTLAVEVRSENDRERDIVAKRADYFEAGTMVVWDVDVVANTIHSYLASAPSKPIEFRPGVMAHAEPAVPGWTIDVEHLFRP